MPFWKRLRRLPPVCMIVGLGRLIFGRLRFPARHVGATFTMEDGGRFTVFRHMTLKPSGLPEPRTAAVFIARLRFARFSQHVNRLLSLIPIPLIAGSPGFRCKLWMADASTGDWQGVYEWESEDAARDYARSLAFRVMTRRASPGTVTFRTLANTRLGTVTLP